MKFLILLVLMCAGACVGQQPVGKSAPVSLMQNKVEIQPAPLKCGKWKHSEPSHGEGTSNLMATIVPDRCVPDMHTVTEREWQELQERMRNLNEALCTHRSNGVPYFCFKGEKK